MLLLTKNRSVLYVDSRYREMAKSCSFLDVKELSIDTQKELSHLCKQEKVLFDPTQISYERFCQLKKQLSPSKLQPDPLFFEAIRSMKSAEEIKRMKKSAEILWEGFCHAKSLLKRGITEEKVAQEILLFCVKKGATGWSFEPNISFGANSALPHHRAGSSKLKKGDTVLMDIGVVFDHYHSDMTRTLFFGKPDPKLARLSEIVLAAHSKVLASLRPGISIGTLDEIARSVFRQEGVEDLFIHALGHGIGLQVHEFPRIKYNGQDRGVLLEEGMVLCIEPGLYLPGKGGIRHEDTLLITKKSYRNFYPFDNK